MDVHHDYAATVSWTDPAGTRSFSSYSRDHEVVTPGKAQTLEMSAPAWYRGTASRHAPGDLFLAAVASGHMVRFLEVASEMGLVVTEYHDDAQSSCAMGSRGDGKMAAVTLRPSITVRPGPHAHPSAVALMHERAQSMSVVRRSVLVDVVVEPGELLVVPEPAVPGEGDVVGRLGARAGAVRPSA